MNILPKHYLELPALKDTKHMSLPESLMSNTTFTFHPFFRVEHNISGETHSTTLFCRTAHALLHQLVQQRMPLQTTSTFSLMHMPVLCTASMHCVCMYLRTCTVLYTRLLDKEVAATPGYQQPDYESSPRALVPTLSKRSHQLQLQRNRHIPLCTHSHAHTNTHMHAWAYEHCFKQQVWNYHW